MERGHGQDDEERVGIGSHQFADLRVPFEDLPSATAVGFGAFRVPEIAFVMMNMLLFARFFPLIPLFESKESQVFTTDMKIGRATVPAVLREQE